MKLVSEAMFASIQSKRRLQIAIPLGYRATIDEDEPNL